MRSTIRELVFCMVDPEMFIVSNINQSCIASPRVRVNDGGDINLTNNDWPQGLRFAVWNDFSIHCSIALKDTKDWLLKGSSSACFIRFSFDPFRTKVALIKLHLANKLSQFICLLMVDNLSELIKVRVNRVPVYT